MDVLPYAHLTTQELLRLILTKDDLTELEQELSQRLYQLIDRVEDLENGDDA
jgi:hypothetical protein